MPLFTIHRIKDSTFSHTFSCKRFDVGRALYPKFFTDLKTDEGGKCTHQLTSCDKKGPDFLYCELTLVKVSGEASGAALKKCRTLLGC